MVEHWQKCACAGQKTEAAPSFSFSFQKMKSLYCFKWPHGNCDCDYDEILGTFFHNALWNVNDKKITSRDLSDNSFNSCPVARAYLFRLIYRGTDRQSRATKVV